MWFSDRFGGEQAGISALAAGVLLNRADDEKKAMLRPDFVVNLGGTLIDDKFKACLRVADGHLALLSHSRKRCAKRYIYMRRPWDIAGSRRKCFVNQPVDLPVMNMASRLM